MNKAAYMALVDKELNHIRAIVEAKNNDYTAGSESAFSNFEDTGEMVTPFVGVLLRMGDKFQRLRTFAKTGTLAVKGESAKDAALDLIGYSLIVLGMLEDMRQPVRHKLSHVDEDVKLLAELRAHQVKADK